MRRRRWFIALGWAWAVLVLAGAVSARLMEFYLTRPTSPGAPAMVIDIPARIGLKGVAELLAEKGVITHPEAFMAAAVLQGVGRKIKAGEYNLSASLSPAQVIAVLAAGTPLRHRVTFPEGLAAREMADRLAEAGLVKPEAFLATANDPALALSLGLPALGVEGYLFPDTYHFSRGQTPEQIIRLMVGRFKDVYASVKAAGPADTGLTDHQTVILASIVEAEAQHGAERPLIAGVFLNRLKKNMLLQADPTVVYGVSEAKGRITKDQLTAPHPYNTYVHPGLPPGPIGNPGLSALKAALHPAKTNYLYFVSRNDGTHQFSESYEKHQLAVRKYQR